MRGLAAHAPSTPANLLNTTASHNAASPDGSIANAGSPVQPNGITAASAATDGARRTIGGGILNAVSPGGTTGRWSALGRGSIAVSGGTLTLVNAIYAGNVFNTGRLGADARRTPAARVISNAANIFSSAVSGSGQ